MWSTSVVDLYASAYSFSYCEWCARVDCVSHMWQSEPNTATIYHVSCGQTWQVCFSIGWIYDAVKPFLKLVPLEHASWAYHTEISSTVTMKFQLGGMVGTICIAFVTSWFPKYKPGYLEHPPTSPPFYPSAPMLCTFIQNRIILYKI